MSSSTTILPPVAGGMVGAPANGERVSLRTWIAVAAGMLGAFMAVLDIQITNSSLKDILGSLSATQEEGSWISTAYLCAEIVVIPMTALLTRVLGLRTFMVGTTALFVLFSTLCGTAWNLPSMIVFRMLQGLTGGTLIPMAMTLVMTKLPPSKRAVGMAIFGLTATLAPAMGPTLGGYLSQLYGWPSIFYINWVPGALLIAGMLWGLDREPMQLKDLYHADWLGIIGMGLYGSSFLLPLYLGQIAGYTPMQIGEVIMWVGLPQLFVMPFAAALSSRVDNRILCSIGLALFGASCLMNASLDATTGYDQLLVSQIVRSLGQPFIMLTLSNFAMQGVAPRDMPSASSLFNMTRNLGGSVGIALLATALTQREQFHSARLGESVSMLNAATQQRLDQLTQSFIASGVDAANAANQAIAVIDRIVRREAYVMAYNDGFWIIGFTLIACIGALWFADKVKSPSGAGAGGAH